MTDFRLDEAHLMAQKMFRAFAENEVKPIAAEVDELERFPEETVPKLAKLGMLGIPFPREYGGAGADNLTYALCMEEICRCCATTGVVIAAHTSLCATPIYDNGTEEQKRKYLPKMCSGEWLGAFGLTEPNAGSDAQGQQTTAVLDETGENWILNGNKIFISNAAYAHVFVVIAVTGTKIDRRGKKGKELSAFIVERTDPGFSVGKHERKMGIRGSSTCELVFEDCVIPKDRLLGKQGKGFAIAMKTLDGGRVGMAAQALGIGQGALDEAVKYTQERVQFGRPISQFQNTQFQLADMKVKVEATRMLVYRAALAKDQHDPQLGLYSSIAKLHSAEMANDVTRRAVQLFGGYGYTRDYPVERMMRDAKITEIYEGTSEVQRIVISKAMGL